MPKKSRLENILFTLVMAFVMVYTMTNAITSQSTKAE